MIERKFIAQKTKEFYIQKYVEKTLGNVGISSIKLKKIPLGEKLVINTSRPSLIVGSKGSNIKSLTRALKSKFELENPQIEIEEIRNPFLDANIVAERIVSSLERFGSARFKGVGHKMLESVMAAGALGVEIFISGKIPGARAKSWRFYMGYLKKCGDLAITGVRKAKKSALLKSGIIGVKVSIMPADLILPDKIVILAEPTKIIEEIKEEVKKKAVKKKAAPKKRAAKKKSEIKAAAPEDQVQEEAVKVETVETAKDNEEPTEKVAVPAEVTEPEVKE